MSMFNPRGIFLQKLGPSIVDPNEVLVSMQFAFKEDGWNAEKAQPTQALLDSSIVIAASYDGGKSFRINKIDKDVDGDGNVDDNDKAKLLVLAKAYASIVNP